MNSCWLYDIILDNKVIVNSGDLEFDSREEARADADDYIISELEKEYNRKPKDFNVICYQSFIRG